jgi:alkylated DNA repair protein (DNA oxidative demethylase)
MTSLFDLEGFAAVNEPLEEGAVFLHGFAKSVARLLVEEAERVAQAAPFRHLVMPGGYTMSVAMTNCGRAGWISDRSGYRYDPMNVGSSSERVGIREWSGERGRSDNDVYLANC